MAAGIRCVIIELVNVLFSIPIRKEDQEQLTFTWNGQCYAFTVFSLGCVESLAPCHHRFQRAVDHVCTLQNVTLIHATDNIKLSRRVNRKWRAHWRP